MLIYSEFHFVKINDEKFHQEHHTITTVVNNKHPGAMKVIAVFNPSDFHIEALTENLPLYSIIDIKTSAIGDLPAGQPYYLKDIK